MPFAPLPRWQICKATFQVQYHTVAATNPEPDIQGIGFGGPTDRSKQDTLLKVS